MDGRDPPYMSVYPLLYNHCAVINDFLLREVAELLRKKGSDALLIPFAEWQSNESTRHMQSVFVALHDEPIRLVGGMLLAGGYDYLFDAAPFIERRRCDLRCRFGYRSALFDVDSTPEDQGTPRADGSPASLSLDASAAMTTHSPQSLRLTAADDRQRIYFHFCEYSGLSTAAGDWEVQTFQLVGKHGPRGKVLYRAHMTAAAQERFKAAREASLVASAAEGGPADEGHQTQPLARMPLKVEEHLRQTNPDLLEWCLKRDPDDMGVAIGVIRAVIEYHRYSFTLRRTINALLRAARIIQRFMRRLKERRTAAERLLLNAWSRLEETFAARVRSYQPLPGDEVERIVNSTLRQRCVTSEQWKRGVLRRIWDARKKRLRAEQLQSHQAFSWWIDPVELLAIQQQMLEESLTRGPDSVFHHPKIYALFNDTANESSSLRRALRDIRMAALTKLDGRRLPAFGSTASRWGGPEHSLTVHTPPRRASTVSDDPWQDVPDDASTLSSACS